MATLGLQLLIATAMVTLTMVIHLTGLWVLLAMMRAHRQAAPSRQEFVRQAGSILIAAFGLFALHSVEIWAYAAIYDLVGVLPDFESALYFSTATYTTIGYGDLTLPKPWRILGAIEGANGIILLGWSTAFFVSVVTRLRLLERHFDE
jgi:hypothetical protein